MKNALKWFIVIAIVAALAVIKVAFFSGKEEQARARGGGQGPVAVNYHVVKHAPVTNSIFATGVVGAFNEVEIIPEVSGKVVSIHFTEGEAVKEGSLLVRLNDQDLQAQLVKIRAQLRMAEQQLGRLKKLLDVSGVSREEYELQENQVATLKADENFVLAQIQKTNITAPFSGVAGLRNISPGAFVGMNTPIVSLVQMKPVYIEFSVPEKYAAQFREGLVVDFGPEAFSGAGTNTAVIFAVEPRVDAGTRSIRARARYSGDAAFYPGTFVNVRVNFGITENAIMVPSQCVVPTIKGDRVFLVRGDSAVETPVETGVRTERMLQVTEGLRKGDTIVASGFLAVRGNSKLKLLKETD